MVRLLVLNIVANVTSTGTFKNSANITSQSLSDWAYENNNQTTILKVNGALYSPQVDVSVKNYPWYYDYDC